MRYHALAVDFDGTLAHDGVVEDGTVDALRRVTASGRKLVLVTGRELPELLAIFPAIDLFQLVVAENGALLYWPATQAARPLADPPLPAFVTALRATHIAPLSIGATIVATVHPHETVVLECIRALGLEMQVIFNKGAVMVLPSGVNKASGLAVALAELALSPHNVVAIGDAENDHSMLELAEYGVAVANAVPMLQAAADHVTAGARGAGVVELIGDLLAHDLGSRVRPPARREILLGRQGAVAVTMPAAGINLLVAGASGSGKSTLATGVLERLVDQGYQCCVIDPEGDYAELEEAVVFGSAERAPSMSEILTALDQPGAHVVVSLIGLPLAGRPAFFMSLLPRLQELRSKWGRPHWILVDETHHLFPPQWEPVGTVLPQDLDGMIYVTVHPESVAPAILAQVNVIAVVGEQPDIALGAFAAAADVPAPAMPQASLERGEALVWFRDADAPPAAIRMERSRSEGRRHRRKYSEGELPPERSFYFRGPAGKLNLRAQNLILFNQLAEGIDDETWLHHLRRGDYSVWLRDCIKDEDLADLVRAVETTPDANPIDSRARIRSAVEQRYTLPATREAPR